MPSRTPRPIRSNKLTASEPEEAAPVYPSREKSSRLVVFVLVVLLGAALAVAGYFYYQYRHSAQVTDAKEIENLSKEIGAMMLLPEGETPTLATVTDKEKLMEQPFFQKAENGDKVLIYSTSGRAILYRPSMKKIIDVTTVNVNQPAASTEQPVATSEPTTSPLEPPTEMVPVIVRVALLNGSKTVGITNVKEKQLTTAYSNIAVVSKDVAKKNDYQQTIVVDVTGKSADMASKIASVLKGSVVSLPEGEAAPTDADIVVIIGQE